MRPFDFIITLLSFVYSLALTHLLLGVARLVRHRRTIRFSPEHLLWTVNVLFVIVLNWVTLWDFRGAGALPLASIAGALMFAVLLYMIATFVTADVDSPDGRDLRRFHDEESRTYVGGLLLGAVLALGLNLGAGSMGIGNWVNQNGLLLAALPFMAAALVWRRGWINLLAGVASLAITLAFLVIYYPVLR